MGSVAMPLAQEMWATASTSETVQAPAVATPGQETGGATATPWVAASGLMAPMSLAMTPDGRTLLITQLCSFTLMACDRDPATNKLSNLHGWAELPGAYCNGLCLD